MFKLNNQLYKIIKRIQNNENNKLKSIQLYNGSSKIINLLHNNTILLYKEKHSKKKK